MSRLISTLLLLTGLAYPFAIYFGLQYLTPRFFALLLGGLWLARALRTDTPAFARVLTVPVLLFCLFLGTRDDPALLRWYPVLTSLAFLALFGQSLIAGMPLVERLARLQDPVLSPRAVRYTRQVTVVWTGFFAANALIATLLTLCAPLFWWTLYTGLIAYLLMGLLFAGEWMVRQKVRTAS